MILTIQHMTRYSYGSPARAVVQSHRLTPSRFDGQKVISWAVSVSGGRMGGEFRDGAGDLVTGWTIPGPVDSVEVMVQGVVETTDLSGMLKGHRESAPPEAYLRGTEATQMYADDFVILSRGHAAEALAQGQGVCQDHAQVLAALARYRGLPARYVSGY